MSEHRYMIDKIYKKARNLQSESIKGLSQVGEIYNASNFAGRKKRKAKS